MTYNKQGNIPCFNYFKRYRNDTKVHWVGVWFCLGFFEKQREYCKEKKKEFMVKIWARIIVSRGKYTRIYLIIFDAWNNVWMKESWGHWDPF